MSPDDQPTLAPSGVSPRAVAAQLLSGWWQKLSFFVGRPS